MNKRKKISLISSLFLLGSVTTPILLTSCKNIQNYLDGSVLDNGNNNSTNNQDNKTGNLSEDLKKLENENVKVHSMNVSNSITIKDYEKESKENNRTLFIHERGNLLEKKLQATIRQNKDDFIKKFDFKSYVNNLPNDQKQILNPSNQSFLKDLKSFIISVFYENNEFFDVKLKNTNSDSIVNYDKNNNTISFDITFILKNVSNKSQTFKYLNASHEMFPNNEVEFSLSVKNATITNVVNFVSNRYLLGWETKNVNFKIGTTNGIFESFVPTKKLVSHAYNMEFFNLSNDMFDYIQANNGSEEFIKTLTPKLIKDQLNENVLNNQKIVFDSFPDVANVFGILEKNLTFGETISELSNPLGSILKKFNVADNFLIDFLIELLKSFDTGESTLKIFVDFKERFIEFISTSLGASFGDLNSIIAMIFDPISMDMTEESKKEILSFFDSLTFTGVKEIKEIVSKVFNKTPTVDLVDYALTNLKTQLKSFMNSANINDKASDLIFDIVVKLIDREKKADGSSIVNGKKVFYKNNILDIFFKDTSTKSWLYESLATVLKTYGIDVKGVQKGLLDEIIKQIYVNNSKISVNSMQGVFRELKNAFAFFGNKKNYEIIFETKKDVTYNNETNKVDFEFISKVVLKTDYTFILDKFFNLLPYTVNLSFAQLNVDVKQYEWALKLLGFSTTHATVKTNLITRMFPKKISFSANDSFVLKYTPVDGKIFYKQQQKSGNYYHGFTSMVNASWYIEQRAPNDGVITNLYKDFNSTADYNQVTENLVQYQYQAEQNYKMFDTYTQNLLVNKINTTIWLNGIDESAKINSPINDTLYRDGKVFRWYDTDFTNEIFKIGSSTFGSKAYDNLVSKIKYRDAGLQKIKVSRVKDNKNSIETKELTRQEAYFEQNDQNQIANTLYYLGNGIDSNKDVTKSIKPLFHFKTSKDIGIGVNILGANVNLKKININIELMAFEVLVVFPYNVLDATSYYKDGNNNRLSNVKFSNHFSKTIVVPRLSIVL